MSWIVTRRSDGTVVCELFDRRLVERVNRTKYAVETTIDYLFRLNSSNAQSTVPDEATAVSTVSA